MVGKRKSTHLADNEGQSMDSKSGSLQPQTLTVCCSQRRDLTVLLKWWLVPIGLKSLLAPWM